MDNYLIDSANINGKKVKSAIDFLLSSGSTQVPAPTVQLTECSPDVDVVMNKQGGICTKCHAMFKSRTSLISHLEKCNNININDTNTVKLVIIR